MIGRLGAGSLGRFALARGIGGINTTPARLTQLAVETAGHLAATQARLSQLAVETLGHLPTTQARLSQLAVEVIGPTSRERFRVVMI